MADESDGYRVAPGKRQPTLALISSLPATVASQRFISSSISYREPDRREKTLLITPTELNTGPRRLAAVDLDNELEYEREG